MSRWRNLPREDSVMALAHDTVHKTVGLFPFRICWHSWRAILNPRFTGCEERYCYKCGQSQWRRVEP